MSDAHGITFDNLRLVQTTEYRTDVFTGERHLGYTMRIPNTLRPVKMATGRIVNFIACPASGGLDRSERLGLANCENIDEAILVLMMMALSALRSDHEEDDFLNKRFKNPKCH